MVIEAGPGPVSQACWELTSLPRKGRKRRWRPLGDQSDLGAAHFRVAVPYRWTWTKLSSRHRVKVYLDLDFPSLADSDRITAALGVRLFQYVRHPLPEVDGGSPTLPSLLQDESALLFFTAGWDGSAPGYRVVVGRVAVALGLRVVDVDIDDPVGSGLARLHRVMSMPCVVGAWNPDLRVIGARAEDDLTALFGQKDRL